MRSIRLARLFTLVAGGFALMAAVEHASATGGIFGSDIGLQSNVFNSGGTTFFEADLLGDSRHAPIASSTVTLPVTLNTTGFNGLNLGTFNPSGGDTLIFKGGETLTFKNTSTDITGSTLSYKIDNGSFTNVGLAFNQDNVSNNNGDQRWASTSFSTDLLSNLAVGMHTISFFTSATTNSVDSAATVYDSNSSNNYTASFTVVPEPATWAAGGLTMLAGAAALRRRLLAI